MPHTVTDYDSPWKVAIRQYFPIFVTLLAPWLQPQIDCAVSPTFLDKELQAIHHASATGQRHTDMLVQVYTQAQQPIWLLIYIEVLAVAPAVTRRASLWAPAAQKGPAT
ncbi:hypothetical protein H0A58_11685 [Alcaligenaceae bacterium]|nr:hypothetical protein [Alcaligenaceae bacterium]